MTDIAAARRALVDRIRGGDGRASTAQRQAAFDMAEAFGFAIPSPDAMNAGAKFLLARGYR